MQPFHLRSAAEQVAEHLRAGLESGVWRQEMPGETALAKGLGVNPKTVQAVVENLVAAAAAYALDAKKLEPCEAALRQVQAYAVNAGDGPLMRACAAFALQLSSAKGLRPEAVRAALAWHRGPPPSSRRPWRSGRRSRRRAP